MKRSFSPIALSLCCLLAIAGLAQGAPTTPPKTKVQINQEIQQNEAHLRDLDQKLTINLMEKKKIDDGIEQADVQRDALTKRVDGFQNQCNGEVDADSYDSRMKWCTDEKQTIQTMKEEIKEAYTTLLPERKDNLNENDALTQQRQSLMDRKHALEKELKAFAPVPPRQTAVKSATNTPSAHQLQKVQSKTANCKNARTPEEAACCASEPFDGSQCHNLPVIPGQF